MGNICIGFSDAKILFVLQKPIIEIIAGFSNSARKTFLAKLENLQIQNVICVLQLAHYSPDKSAANIANFSRQIEHLKKMDGDR